VATLRGASSLSLTAATGSLAKPSGVVSGDVQWVLISEDGNPGTPTISGGATWTALGTLQNVTNGDLQCFILYRQIAGGAEPANYTISAPSGNATSVVCVAYAGVDNATPEAATTTVNNPNSASPPSSPVTITGNSITTTAANQTVLMLYGVDWNSGSAAAFTAPSGFTARATETPAQFSNGQIADKVFTSAGATGSITATGTLAGQVGNFVAFVVAIKDAATDTLMGQICI
jgi:hypothetical protein